MPGNLGNFTLAIWITRPPDNLQIPQKRNARKAGSRAFPLPFADRFRAVYFTNWLILKIGRMIDIAMNPTMPPIATIIIGSIMLVTALIVTFNSLL